MRQALLLFAFWACLTVSAGAQTLAEKLDALVSTAAVLQTSEVGICVYDLTTGIPIYRYQADKLYRPASIEKIVTAVTALSELGKDYPYQTRLAYTGSIEEGRLKGDVYVVGGFDSEFMESDLELLADTLCRSGIRQIDGRLVGDVSMTDSVYWGKGWSWDDAPEAFQPYLSPLMLNRGCVDVTIAPGSQGAAGKVEVSPASDYYQTDNRTLSRTPSAGRLRITRDWMEHGNRILLRGNVTSRQSTTISLYNSQAFFMETLRYQLEQKGIETVSDSVDYASVPAEALTIYIRRRPLEEILHRALKESDNLAAQSTSLTRIGNIFADMYEQNAFEFFGVANDLASETDNAKVKGFVSSSTGRAYEKFGEPQEALKSYSNAVKNYTEAESPLKVAQNYVSAADIMLDYNSMDKARGLLKKAQKFAEKTDDTYLINDIKERLSQIA